MTVATQFAELFRGRLDAYGTDAGGCDRPTEATYDEYLRRVRDHLDGSVPMGVYPLTDNGVRWGCTDLDDTGDDPTQALNLATMLRAAGLNAWVEISRSKGHHIWSFASEWVPAETMRNAFLAAHQRLELPAKEVNPKSISGGSQGFGNYVRLPYPGGYVDRQVMLAGATAPLALAEFVGLAQPVRTPRAAYEAVAARYVKPPPLRQVQFHTESQDVDNTHIQRMSREMYLAFRYGPREGHDRSNSLIRLAHFARDHSFSPSDAYVIVADADRRWGKFSERADCELQLTKIIERAYG